MHKLSSDMVNLMKRLGFLLQIFFASLCSTVPLKLRNLETEFMNFKINFNKSYSTVDEEKLRMEIFKQNLMKIEEHNERYRRNETTFEMAMNHFGDYMHHEYHKHVHGYLGRDLFRNAVGGQPAVMAILNASVMTSEPDAPVFLPPANVKIPDEVDWRVLGAVTPVKHQGRCGACWAFSATGALEGQIFRKTGVLTNISEQNLIDCSGNYGNVGCRGGLMTQAFKYVKDNGGVESEAAYPYEGGEKRCRYVRNGSVATDSGYMNIKNEDEEHVKAAVATVGPICSAIDAKYDTFHFYSRGVYHEPRCTNNIDLLNHGVLIVGYGTDPKKGDYWIIKNSWGPRWGDKGYMRIARNRDNHCGTATACSFPLV
nr:PREDICTED: cathepsin L1-like isoform X1 [Bemisia tabaci]XP_018904485.1 PREDICTED: cathepsin L1-like isoform X1 [Bemisia tabaci]XP_018904486.1 PREDICTED: cathepsin L1-like isoform X1 [Bemisia tabaci]